MHRMHGWLNNGEASTAFAPAENFTCAPNAWVVNACTVTYNNIIVI